MHLCWELCNMCSSWKLCSCWKYTAVLLEDKPVRCATCTFRCNLQAYWDMCKTYQMYNLHFCTHTALLLEDMQDMLDVQPALLGPLCSFAESYAKYIRCATCIFGCTLHFCQKSCDHQMCNLHYWMHSTGLLEEMQDTLDVQRLLALKAIQGGILVESSCKVHCCWRPRHLHQNLCYLLHGLSQCSVIPMTANGEILSFSLCISL